MIGPPANPSRHGSADAGNGNRNRSQSQTDDNADKYRHQVRFLQAFHCIAQHLLHILYGSSLAHYGQAVTQLQGQFRCGQATARHCDKPG